MVKLLSPWVTKLKSGKYKMRARYVDPLSLKYRTVNTTILKDTPQARRKGLGRLQAKADKKTGEAKKSGLSLQEAADKYDKYLHEVKTPYSSYRSFYFSKQKAIAYFGPSALIRKIDRKHVSDFLNHLLRTPSRLRKDGLANGTVRAVSSHMSGMYKYLISRQLASDNPFLHVAVKWKDETRKHLEERKYKYLTPDQLTKVLNYLKSRKLYHYVDLFQFLAEEGTRISEALALTYDDFFEKNGTRYAKIDSVMVERHGKLANYHVQDNKEPHVKTKAGYRNIILSKKACEIVDRHKFGLDPETEKFCTSHIFRHTFISNMVAKGVPKRVIMQQVGQENSKMIDEIYSHVTPSEIDQLKRAMS